jgi:hypothetical protein
LSKPTNIAGRVSTVREPSGTPPSFLPTAMYDEELKVVKAAFAEMQRLDAAQTRNMR